MRTIHCSTFFRSCIVVKFAVVDINCTFVAGIYCSTLFSPIIVKCDIIEGHISITSVYCTTPYTFTRINDRICYANRTLMSIDCSSPSWIGCLIVTYNSVSNFQCTSIKNCSSFFSIIIFNYTIINDCCTVFIHYCSSTQFRNSSLSLSVSRK